MQRTLSCGRLRFAGCLVACAWTVAGGAGAVALGRAERSVRGAPLNVPVIIEEACWEDVPEQGALALVAAEDAWQVATGAGVRVAVLDGGFDLAHEALDGVLADAWDALDEDSGAGDAGNSVDDDADGVTDRCVGHGTFVAGLVHAGAPDAEIVPVRVLDDEGRTTPDALARGIEYAVSVGADVINLSLVAPVSSAALEDALEVAEAAGVVVVTSAGNDPAGTLDCALLHSAAITVGAVDNDLAVAAFSPNGAWIDVFAPGVDVLGPHVDDAYATWSGSSFSCAFVSAAAALVREVAPATTTSSMRTRLAAAVDAVTGATAAGRGSVDLAMAVEE